MCRISKIFGLLLILLSFGCKSYDVVNFQSRERIANKLPKMKIYYDTEMINQIMKGQCIGECKDVAIDVIDYEINNNLFGEEESDYTFRVTVIEDDYKMNVTGAIFWGVSLGTLAILGVPGRVDKLNVTIRCHILDQYLNPIKSYRATGEGVAHVACYYGFKRSASIKQSYAEAVSDAFSKIRKDIEKDCEGSFSFDITSSK